MDLSIHAIFPYSLQEAQLQGLGPACICVRDLGINSSMIYVRPISRDRLDLIELYVASHTMRIPRSNMSW